MAFARAHWVQEIRGIKIKDGKRIYSWSRTEIGHLTHACPSSEMARRVSFASDCYLIYLGDGRLRATADLPDGINYEEVGNGS